MSRRPSCFDPEPLGHGRIRRRYEAERPDVVRQVLRQAAGRLQLLILTSCPVPAEVARRTRFIRLQGEP